jgi:hypothetical protein
MAVLARLHVYALIRARSAKAEPLHLGINSPQAPFGCPKCQ